MAGIDCAIVCWVPLTDIISLCSGTMVVVSVSVNAGSNEFKLYSTTGNVLSSNAVTVETMELEVSRILTLWVEHSFSPIPDTSAL